MPRALALLALFAAPVLADDSLVGQPAPDFAGARIFHGDGRTSLSEFRGDVVLVVFFCTICKTQWIEGPVEDLIARYGSRGFAVLGYLGGETSIDEATTEKARRYVEGMDFPVFFGADLSRPGTVEPFNGWRPAKRPHAFLVGADGRVAWRGEPGGVTVPAAEIERALAARWEGVAARFDGAPREALDHLRSGRVAKAYSAAREGGAEELAAELGKGPSADLARAAKLEGEKELLGALEIYERVAREWKGTDLGEAAEAKVRAFRASEMRKELAAAEKLRALEAELAGKDPEQARAAYATFAKRHAGTAAGERAGERAK